MRTLRVAGHAAEPVLRPSARLLPVPVQDLALTVIRRAEAFGDRIATPPIPSSTEISIATGVLLEPQPGLDAQVRLVGLLAFGISGSLIIDGLDDRIVGESRLALLLARLPAPVATDRVSSLAYLANSILRSHAVFGPDDLWPGNADVRSRERLAVFSAMLWLALDRGEKEEEETRLLHLCVEVSGHSRADIELAVGDNGVMAALLSNLANII